MIRIDVHHWVHFDPSESTILDKLNQLESKIMSTSQEIVDRLTAVAGTLGKISGETSSLLTKVADLQTALDAAIAAGQSVDPAIADAVAAVASAADAVDGLVADL